MTNAPYPLTLLYDAACPVCSLEMDHLRERNHEGRLAFVDIAAPGFDAAAYGATLEALNAEIHGVRPDGSLMRGLPVLRAAYVAVGLGWALSFTGLPGMNPLFDRAYRLFARHRQRISRASAPLIDAIRAGRARRRLAAMAVCRSGACAVPLRDDSNERSAS